MFRGRPFLFSAVSFFSDLEDFSRCAFSLQGKKKPLSFLTFSLSIFKVIPLVWVILIKVIPLKCSTFKLFLKLGVMNIHDMNIIKMQ